MTNASLPTPDERSAGPGASATKRSGTGRWALLAAVVAVGVAGSQWYSAHRAEQTRRKLAATERMVGLEQARDVARAGGERLAVALAGGKRGEWQRLAVSVRSGDAHPANLDGPKPLFDELVAPVFADMERKLRAAAGALAAPDADWQEVDRVLAEAAAFLPMAERVEQRVAAYMAQTLWTTAAAASAAAEFAQRFASSPLPHLARARAGLVAGDDAKVASALIPLAWLYEPARVALWQALTAATVQHVEQLGKVFPPRAEVERDWQRAAEERTRRAGATRSVGATSPLELTGDGPVAWLRAEAAAVEAQWLAADAATEVARWEQANQRAADLLQIVGELRNPPAEAPIVTAYQSEREAADVVPRTAWIRLEAAMVALFPRLWAVDVEGARSQFRLVTAVAAECAQWAAEVEPTKVLVARWQAVPAACREQAAPTAAADFAAAVASTSIDLAGFQSAQATLARASAHAGEVWLQQSLTGLAPRLGRGEAGARAEWEALAAWFGNDARLQPLRAAAAAAAAAAEERARPWRELQGSGFREASGSTKDPATGLPKRIEHVATGAVLVLIPAGELTMGSPASEERRDSDEVRHRRQIRQPFYLGVTEVTQAQWRKVMGTNPSRFQGDDLPVEQGSWEDCQQFVQKAGGGLRLPSEAEWEYACRAGTTTPFAFGSTITPAQVNYDGNYPYGDASKGPYRERTVAAGSLPANAMGLHEMHGNVWEWCQDGYEAYPGSGTEEPSRAGARVLRGGSWYDNARNCRAAARGRRGPGGRYGSLGLRLARTLPE